MAQNISTVVRPRVLSNSAAEFLETRAQQALGVECEGLRGPQFVPVRDQFMSTSDIPNHDYHRESADQMKQLEKSLQNFCRIIKERGFDKKLNIALKDPGSYKTEEILQIVGKIEVDHQNADKVKSCMGRIRRCFRSAGENHGQWQRLLNFIPNDKYGSVVSGGFTIILGAAERAEGIRNEIYETLASIPDMLREIHDLAEVHQPSAEMQIKADAVFVSIFSLLDEIVQELTKSMSKKGMSLIFRGDRSAFKFEQSSKDLQRRLKEFRLQADICSEQRLGRVERNVMRTRLAAENVEFGVADLHDRFSTFEQRVQDGMAEQSARQLRLEQEGRAFIEHHSAQENELQRRQSLQNNVYNTVYVFLTANPSFDSRTGSIDRDQLQLINGAKLIRPGSKQSFSRIRKNNKYTVKQWLSRLSPVFVNVNEDATECLSALATLPNVEKSRIQWILTSEEIHDWLKSSTSNALILEPETYPSDIGNSMSFSVAFLMKSLKVHDYPIASYFCYVQAIAAQEVEYTAPEAMMRSLFLQLLRQIKTKRDTIDLSTIGDPSRYEGSVNEVEGMKRKIRKLLGLLDEGDSVFLLIDSVAHLKASQEDIDDAIGSVLNLLKKPGIIVKILVTGIMSYAAIADQNTKVLMIPDFVDGENQDTMTAIFEEDISQSILEGLEEQHVSDSSSDDGTEGDIHYD